MICTAPHLPEDRRKKLLLCLEQHKKSENCKIKFQVLKRVIHLHIGHAGAEGFIAVTNNAREFNREEVLQAENGHRNGMQGKSIYQRN